jgi:ComF family protein
MFDDIFTALCAGCGVKVAYRDFICDSCVNKLEKVAHRCSNCGHPLAVDAAYCRYCQNKWIDHYFVDYIFIGLARKMVIDIKYKWRFRGSSQIERLCRGAGIDFNGYDAMVSIPTHFLRRFMRFVQPVDIIKRSFSGCVKPFNALKRNKHTDFQSRLGRVARAANVKGVFTVVKTVKKMKILLIDDIITTGSTLTEAAKALKKAGAAKVDVYAMFTGVPR